MHPTTVRWTENEQLPLNLPQHWQLLGRYVPRTTEPIANLSARLAENLQKPLGRQALSTLLAKARKVALVIDDLTRATPVQILLEPVLAALQKAGITDDQLTAVVATGTHPPLSHEQLISKVGGQLARRFRWLQNDCHRLDRYVHLGKTLGKASVPQDMSSAARAATHAGLDVYLLKELAQADLIIMFSSVSPHLQAGFGGGHKLLFPGCAHVSTINSLHRIGLDDDVARLVGQQPAQNHMRQAVEQAGALLGRKVFSISALLDSAGRVCRLEIGHPLQVQQRLSLACERSCGFDVSTQADVAIVSAFPRDYDILQAFKCIANTRMAARERALVIGMMNLRVVGHLRVDVPFTIPTGLLQYILRLMAGPVAGRLLARFDKGLKPEVKFFARLGLDALSRNRVLLYCPQLVKSGVTFPYIEVFDQLQPLWQRAEKLLGKPKQVRVNVFAEGGTSYMKSH